MALSKPFKTDSKCLCWVVLTQTTASKRDASLELSFTSEKQPKLIHVYIYELIGTSLMNICLFHIRGVQVLL